MPNAEHLPEAGEAEEVDGLDAEITALQRSAWLDELTPGEYIDSVDDAVVLAEIVRAAEEKMRALAREWRNE